ncbi:GlxA family transcriptional regulator [Acidiphilium sp. AL]|uniref:GlxA family transcriptional regulator n=1 Tax=Acidiphilium iwatense TaxID=768198 RepID=A0ABS9DR63_9PROT|nr:MULTISPECIES: GlxA family transcriptional regulator [Acidiphilium]MCF3945157.1 GlxA family transcriptional regulator [Acidiphilium iwatense]MCU4160170.1 GlxA family transcriptional regulator [Acidiphilium sp. AL]
MSDWSRLFASAEGRICHIDVLVLPDFSLMSLAATIEPLRAANRASGRELYRWRLLSTDGASPPTSSGIPIVVEGKFATDEIRDALFVVAAFGARRHAAGLTSSLRRLARRDMLLGGIESGSWVLAKAGLLDGCRATTHWEDIEEFAAAFPAVDVVNERYVIDRGRCTTGGAAPTLDMILDMIRARHGLALALDAASIFIYDQKTIAQQPQHIVLAGELKTKDPALARAIGFMETSLTEPLPIETIARQAGLSVRNLQLRFHAQLGMSPYGYYLNLRLAAARRMLQQTRNSVAETAAAYAFGSASAFARAFRSRYGVSPIDARRQASEGFRW